MPYCSNSRIKSKLIAEDYPALNPSAKSNKQTAFDDHRVYLILRRGRNNICSNGTEIMSFITKLKSASLAVQDPKRSN